MSGQLTAATTCEKSLLNCQNSRCQSHWNKNIWIPHGGWWRLMTTLLHRVVACWTVQLDKKRRVNLYHLISQKYSHSLLITSLMVLWSKCGDNTCVLVVQILPGRVMGACNIFWLTSPSGYVAHLAYMLHFDYGQLINQISRTQWLAEKLLHCCHKSLIRCHSSWVCLSIWRPIYSQDSLQ